MKRNNKSSSKLVTFIFVILFCLVNLSLTASDRGADVPFKTDEAEEGMLGGSASINYNSSVKVVSSEKSYVHLGSTGASVEFKNLSAANRLTLRYSIPKNETGTISLYVNNVHNQDIHLVSEQCYDSQNAEMPRRYNEVSVIVNLSEGDRVKIRKDAGDVCSWYGIDLVDTETAPDPLTMPANFLSIIDFGATGDDDSDDTKAIEKCIAAASSQGKGVWIPAGTFHQTTRITIPVNLSMTGAGIWYSTLHNNYAGTTFSNDIGYKLTSGNRISDIKFTGVARARDLAAILFSPVGRNQVLENLWIQNVGCIHGWDGVEANNVIFRKSRVIGAYFDGIHWGDGSAHNNLVENVFFRGLGDDAVAQVNRANMPLCYDNVAKSNTIIASYWGRGLANIGGDNLTYTDNFISSCYLAGMMIATETLGEAFSRPVKGFQFLRNTIRKCGHEGHNHAGIHVWLYTNPMQDVVIKDNIVEYGETGGIHIDSTNYGDQAGRTIFENNIVRYNNSLSYNNTSNYIVPILIKNNGILNEYTGFSDH